ncbi:MFS transporter [Citrobacter sp. Awk 4]|uniref:MFS transporter n=1 Tax=Citrobacter sp. Awk 4 TaxID=2963955 RepID=UPI002303717B|nr:MFS transporter [Citrobacter sp. Awk 4]MDA8477166.1 MFS transporter [Citrobacter sp. Awk 4]
MTVRDEHIIESNKSINIRPFGFRDKFGYMCGDLGNCFILGLVNSFLMIYYTNVLGISGVIVGSLYFVTKLFDAFVDVAVGRLCDTSKLTAKGRFNPWVSRMKYPFCAVAVLLFLPFVSEFSYTAKIIYICGSYFVYGALLSTVNIPYGAMSAAISSNPDDRVSLSTYRSIGSAIGGGATGFFIPILMYTTLVDGSQVISGERFFWISIGCSVLAFIFLTLTCQLTTERVRVETKENVPVSVLLKGLLRNKALIVLVVVDLLIVINQGLSGTNMTYLFNDYFHNKEAMSVALLFTFGSLVLLAPSASWLTKRFGKKEASVGALLFSVGMYLVMYFCHITDAKTYLVFLFLATLGAGLFNLMIWAFMTDVCDYHQYVTGDREDGTVYGVNFFARKVGQACAGAIGGFMLAIIGYQSSSTGGITQSSAVQENIYAMANLLPALCLFLAAVTLIYFYPLNRKQTLEMEKTLNKLNGISK